METRSVCFKLAAELRVILAVKREHQRVRNRSCLLLGAMLKVSLELIQLILEGGGFCRLLGYGGFGGCQACLKLFNIF